MDDDQEDKDIEAIAIQKRLDLVKTVGKPPKFASPEELISLCKKYFKLTPFNELTITGLAIACGTSRNLLCQYEKKDEFKEIVVQCKAIIEHSYEMALRRTGRSGDIFALKNFGWMDVVDLNQKHTGEVNPGINWFETPVGAVLPNKGQIAIEGEVVDEDKS